MIRSPLANLTNSGKIDNILIFISDSTRFDETPERIKKLGASVRAVAPSTWTASSYPSIISGNYPSTHKLWDFSDRGGNLNTKSKLLRSEDNLDIGISAETIWTSVPESQKPPLSIANLTQQRTLSELDPPFVYLEHHKGGHLPYGYSFDQCESNSEFFKNHVSTPDEILPLYRDSISTACDTFLDRVENLREDGLLEDTLVIFTSDHGELLGESQYGGVYGHEFPIVPELVHVPLVFIGAGIEPKKLDGTYSLIDIVPTVLSAQGRSCPLESDGLDLWSSSPPTDRQVRSEVWSAKSVRSTKIEKYRATSLWNSDSGIVLPYGSQTSRFLITSYLLYYRRPSASMTRSSLSFDQLRGLFSTFASSQIHYNDPEFEAYDVDVMPSDFEESSSNRSGNMSIPEEQLENLGYLD